MLWFIVFAVYSYSLTCANLSLPLVTNNSSDVECGLQYFEKRHLIAREHANVALLYDRLLDSFRTLNCKINGFSNDVERIYQPGWWKTVKLRIEECLGEKAGNGSPHWLFADVGEKSAMYTETLIDRVASSVPWNVMAICEVKLQTSDPEFSRLIQLYEQVYNDKTKGIDLTNDPIGFNCLRFKLFRSIDVGMRLMKSTADAMMLQSKKEAEARNLKEKEAEDSGDSQEKDSEEKDSGDSGDSDEKNSKDSEEKDSKDSGDSEEKDSKDSEEKDSKDLDEKDSKDSGDSEEKDSKDSEDSDEKDTENNSEDKNTNEDGEK